DDEGEHDGVLDRRRAVFVPHELARLFKQPVHAQYPFCSGPRRAGGRGEADCPLPDLGSYLVGSSSPAERSGALVLGVVGVPILTLSAAWRPPEPRAAAVGPWLCVPASRRVCPCRG